MFAMNMTRERQKAQNLEQSKKNSSDAQQRKLQRAAEREEAKLKAKEECYDVCSSENEKKGSLDHIGHSDEPKKSHHTLAEAMRKKKELAKEKSVEK